MKDRRMAIISVESSPVTRLILVLPFLLHELCYVSIYLLLFEVQHQPQLTSPRVCTEHMTWWVRIRLLYYIHELKMVPALFTSSQKTDTHWLKS